MGRGRFFILAAAVPALLAAGGPASVFAADSPVPGTPPGVSAGTCGAGVGAGSSFFGAPPTQVGTSGISSPTGCSSGAIPNSTGQNASNSGLARPGTSAANSGATTATGGGQAVGSASEHSAHSANSDGGWLGANAFKLAWLLIALLLGSLLFLLGAAAARRRQAPQPA